MKFVVKEEGGKLSIYVSTHGHNIILSCERRLYFRQYIADLEHIILLLEVCGLVRLWTPPVKSHYVCYMQP